MHKVLSIIFITITISHAYAQSSRPAPVPVSEASSMITLAAELSFVDAYEVPFDNSNLRDIRRNVTFRADFFNISDRTVPVSNNGFIQNSMGEPMLIGGASVRPRILYLYDFVRGASIIAEARLFIRGTVINMIPVSFNQNVLVVYARYQLDLNNQDSRRNVILRISGNWSRYTSEPLFNLSADINKDNRVNPLDLFLLQDQWGKTVR